MGGVLMDDFTPIRTHMSGYKYHWLYVDNELPVMAVARYNNNNEKTYRQFHLQDNEWIEGMPPSPYPLFGLQSLKNSSPLNALLITEGEKCAIIPHQLGWPAISPVLGAQNPAQTDWSICRYFKRFIILRDNDKAGITFAQKVSREIKRTNPTSELLVVNLTSTVPGGDLIDWLQSTILRGQGWNGFDHIPQGTLELIKTALAQEIDRLKVTCEECPEVAFKSIEALFDGEPRPFQVQLTPVPIFPLEIFPVEIQTYLTILSSQFSQKPDYAATAFTITSGGLIGRSVHLKMRASNSWVETANCWGVLVGAPSAKKSPILRKILKLLNPLIKRAKEKYAMALKAYKARQRAAENAKEDFDELPPNLRRYATDDITTPKLRELMAENPRGLILKNDELKGQLERLDKQGSEGDRSFMMSCWSGLEDYSEDRKCRDSLLNTPLALTWIGCIPPGPLQRYLCEAMGRGGGADGFMQRFQLVCYPDHQETFVLSNEAMPTAIEAKIQEIIEQLDTDFSSEPRQLSFNDEAQVFFDQWLFNHENNTRGGAHPIYWEGHLGKQAKVVAVLVIILHRLKEATTGRVEDQVSLDILQAALKAQVYYLGHARRCYDSVVGGAVNDAEIILGLIRQKKLPQQFKAQDIYHQGLGGLSDSGRVRNALALLQDYGWIISMKEGSGSGRYHEFWIAHSSVLPNR
jgi:putative DNA primase/helicase